MDLRPDEAYDSHVLEMIAWFRKTALGKTGLTSERAFLTGDIAGHHMEHRLVVIGLRRVVESTPFKQSLNSARFPI